jgi:hypothetical protein
VFSWVPKQEQVTVMVHNSENTKTEELKRIREAMERKFPSCNITNLVRRLCSIRSSLLYIATIHTTYVTSQLDFCSETTLTGESRFHISTPLGFEPLSLIVGSKRVVHWTSETCCECDEIAGSTQSSPQQPTVGCAARNRDKRAV